MNVQIENPEINFENHPVLINIKNNEIQNKISEISSRSSFEKISINKDNIHRESNENSSKKKLNIHITNYNENGDKIKDLEMENLKKESDEEITEKFNESNLKSVMY